MSRLLELLRYSLLSAWCTPGGYKPVCPDGIGRNAEVHSGGVQPSSRPHVALLPWNFGSVGFDLASSVPLARRTVQPKAGSAHAACCPRNLQQPVMLFLTVFCCTAAPASLLMLPQFFRNRQANTAFQWGSPKQPVSLADIIVAGAVVVVQQCSGQALNITHTFGRPEALAADDTHLPSPTSVIEDKHFSVFQQMVSSDGELLSHIYKLQKYCSQHFVAGMMAVMSLWGTGSDCPLYLLLEAF